MLKLKLTSLDGLPPAIAAEYKPDGDTGHFILDTEVPFEDTRALKNALQQERDQRKTATEKVTALETENTDLRARSGDATALEKSWQLKLEKAQTEAEAKRKALDGQIKTLLVDNVAQSIAAEISTAPALLLPHIKGRLVVAEEDGVMVTRVLDKDGKPSAASVKEFQQEILADKGFSPILIGSKASGGGAQGGSKGGGGGAKAFKDMNEPERVALFKKDPAEFRRLSAEAKTAPPAASSGGAS